MPRFFVNQTLSNQQIISLPDTVVRHIHVLRLRIDSDIILFNGDGKNYHAHLTDIQKRHAEASITQITDNTSESPLHFTLVQAISSGDRMDFTLQKSVELGVNIIQPISTERSIVRLQGERAQKRIERWQEIVISACEQCGRSTIPKVLPILTLTEYLQQLDLSSNCTNTYLLLSIAKNEGIHAITPAPEHITLMAGPEGGLSDNEESKIFATGFQALTLGPRILRTETAALTAIAAMQTLWGDFH